MSFTIVYLLLNGSIAQNLVSEIWLSRLWYLVHCSGEYKWLNPNATKTPLIRFHIQSLFHMTECFRIALGEGGEGKIVCVCVCVCVCLSVCLSVCVHVANTAISQNLLGQIQPNFAHHYKICSSFAFRNIMTSSMSIMS